MKFHVCAHYPLNPSMSKKCLARTEHEHDYVSYLEIPFDVGSRAFKTAVQRMYVLGNINGSEFLLLERLDDEHQA